MLVADALTRFGGIALLLVLAALGWRHRHVWPSSPYLILASLSVSALFLGYVPPEFELPDPLRVFVRFADIPHLVFVWLFALSLYERDFELRPWHIAVGILYSAPIAWLRLAAEGVVPIPPYWLVIYGIFTSVALIGHLTCVTLLGRSDDLIARRRSSRGYFIIVLLLVTVLAALADLLPRGGALDPRTAKIFAIFPAIVFGAGWMLRLDPQGMKFDPPRENPASLSPRDQALLEKLKHEMHDKAAFRDPGMTIARLSAQLGVNQHRLRGLINGHLGYANFSSFINRLRTDAVCAAMRRADAADTPILTLALDAGFTSLSAFNKAFKTNTGLTPSQYRAQRDPARLDARNPSGFGRNQEDPFAVAQ